MNKVINNHFYIGSQRLHPYKKIIQKSAYPPFNHSFSLATAKDSIDACVQSGGSLSDYIELTVFFLECGSHFSSDYGGDMGEDFYEILENTFEEILKKLKSANNTILLDEYKPRLKAIIEIAHESGYGYGDQLDDYWQEIVGD
ncbi:MAG: hypothetical protein WCT20_04415 [Candidatus Babeliales bacterium]|jgi:hypothetical protein